MSIRRVRVGIWAAVWGGLVLSAAQAWPAAVGQDFPVLRLPDVETGAVVEIRPEPGKVLAVVYMQTSCAACRKELLALKTLKARYPGLDVVAVSVDSGSPARVRRYREHFGFDFPFVHDPEFRTPERFGFSFTPALVLVDRDGKIALLKGGYRPGDERELERKIQQLLRRVGQ